MLPVPRNRLRKQDTQKRPSSKAFIFYCFVHVSLHVSPLLAPPELACHNTSDACSESNSGEAKLAWLWREYSHSVQSDAKVSLVLNQIPRSCSVKKDKVLFVCAVL